jgi:hypothetical protein
MGTDQHHLRAVIDGDGGAILDMRAGKISTLNAAGARVWMALQRGEDLEAIAAEITHETGEEIETVKKDVQDFAGALKKEGLLPR